MTGELKHFLIVMYKGAKDKNNSKRDMLTLILFPYSFEKKDLVKGRNFIHEFLSLVPL
jgi:hypothetical protein